MNIPLVPLRDVVIFPGVVTPLFVGRESSINSLQKAMSDDKSVMLIAQKEPNTENPEKKDLYEIGTISTILQLIKLPDGTYKVLVEGIKRAKLQKLISGKDILEAEVDILEDSLPTNKGVTTPGKITTSLRGTNGIFIITSRFI